MKLENSEQLEKLEAMIYRREQMLNSVLMLAKGNKEMLKKAFLITLSLANLRRKLKQAKKHDE